MSKSFIFGIIIFALVVIGGSYFLVAGGKQKSSKDLPPVYNSKDKEKPKVEVKEVTKDLGDMKVSDQKSADFSIKNIGSRELTLFNISSSCGCTVGQIIIEGKESREFGMHAQSDESFAISPDKSALVKVTYRPYIMPVSGLVDREVFVETNDPENPRLTFKVTAFVK
ncbi:hypothetical protein A2954_01930 [Candidatus Roizmanbacteria bacterium RIFCSPLOWO2_01_FULL_37_12]|uniref:DUF1573 domain-containing protein n=1 Tax=Candidatus Roizmanbacteria bacterium RIFCSPLOWO2_01_FULL_37_12 TaxID=1802056 RepID=A0A1F7I9L5_9BACT|nr:MAG: hypothetical protein A2768_01415 [Candidatus Roizmanbacteria bacterium RIFCSPHIGHO2_01_FULL_37_16]OGK23279.1 MAG: hypothetical protein A3D76_00650 [Candidatus Roizmanbacteria bacterium RIFCSPHIGHO2_02_FULL_37_9b]OGK40051.1 MAG: hypothetical protein A2954_01930 [Candidatus Roizmanbacteria bacterium RIFCSPLOWO2_01_FULL_37_12]